MNERELYPGWETVRKIGSGSFGTVYEIARTLPNGKTEMAALKVISIPQNDGDVEELYSSGYDDASITAHFKSYLTDIVNEYSLMAEIKGHTNVVYCDDIRYIQHDDGFGWDIFIKMELLTPLMKAKASGAVEDTVKKLGADICSALVLCREKNIIHRDIKPQNIFVSEHGDYKLGDFGIAKTVEKTTGGTKIGTYGYMAPEVYNNQPYGAAADIYSLGLVMYWLLNEHRLPFLPMPPKVPTSTENEQARLRRFRGEPIPAPKNGSEALKRIVLKACAYDPKERYHTADEMLADLNALDRERVFTKSYERVFPDDSYCRHKEDATEIADAISTETVGVFETDRKKTVAAKASDYSYRIRDGAVHSPDTSSDKTAQTVGVSWKNDSRLEEKPSKKRRYKILPVAVAAILICVVGGIYGYTHCWFGHVWGAADCTVPATCTRCGATNGSALGHNWNAATCTAPETCSRCGVTSGAALGHSWNAATYDAPKTCSVCGLTEGRALKSTQVFAEKYGRKKVVAAGDHFAVGIKPDGSCIVAGSRKPNVSSWTGMYSLSACVGTVAGLRSDGTVVCSDPTLNVRDWKDIVQIDYFEVWHENDHHIVGLTSSGKVVAEGTNRYGECDVSGWEGIVDVAAGATCTVGLRSDGTVVACGSNEYGQCNVSDWVGIVDVAAARYAVYGLTSDGHILVAGQKPLYEGGLVNAVEEVPTPEVSGWDNVVAILAFHEGGDGCDYVVGIREDGTIVTNRSTWAYLDDGDIESFQDVQCIAVASWGYTISVNSQGKVHAVGWDVDGTRIVDTWSLMKK